jgi:hypothetical protein
MARRIQRSSQLLAPGPHPCTRLDHLQAQPGRLDGPAASMPLDKRYPPIWMLARTTALPLRPRQKA